MEAVTDLFEMNYWPYVKGANPENVECINELFKDSPKNLLKDAL